VNEPARILEAAGETSHSPVVTQRAVIYLRVSTAEQAHGDGASEGYSIPAQRDACTRRAADLGAQVVAEFVDRGESARSAARPELQRMLARLAEHKDVDYVIVHKIDRLARNRADDVAIQMGIEKAGARLISVSENVDDTPSGKLVRNIMADLAEFYSANLATEILKGSTQKASMGGTPFRARSATSMCATSSTAVKSALSKWTPIAHPSSARLSSCTPPASTHLNDSTLS
jgi:DNA invertase Pin-like site-specific DNA recombinase